MSKTKSELEAALQAETNVLDTANKRIAELKEQIKNTSGIWKPENGDNYWIVVSDEVDCFRFSDDSADRGYIETGNFFKTKEEAEKHRQRLIVTQKLRELSGGYKPEGKGDEPYYAVVFSSRWEVVTDIFIRIGYIPFETHKAAQHAIDTLGDELNVLLD